MGIKILTDTHDSLAALYDSTVDVAFGPVFYEEAQHDASDRAEAFLRWLEPRDPRRLTEVELVRAYGEWRAQEAAQWAAEATADAGDEEPTLTVSAGAQAQIDALAEGLRRNRGGV